ncbi:flavodoxin family protein [Clostridium sp. CF012]|uniref:flavodoxin family protein n=1 Tax=Clostridium sp. CF012 TaxID=2843319 RepID=UPI001C0CEC27|nr:flavodoxin family protein [Clostridium sp. CF012]MBU3144596.1 flavodoxin family protein [Clostridium sp. CF012]
MRVLILMGSFRHNGNAATFLKPFIDKLKSMDVEVEYVTLTDKNISYCDACWTCQDVFDGYGCPKKDYMQGIFKEVLKADCLILATPIYTWYCTPPMKAVLDRFYGMNKYYGRTTCGYELEYGISPFEDGIKRLCQDSHLEYVGKISPILRALSEMLGSFWYGLMQLI